MYLPGFLRINIAAPFLPLMLPLLELVATRVLSSDNKSTLASKTGSLVKTLETFIDIQSSRSCANMDFGNSMLRTKSKENLINRILGVPSSTLARLLQLRRHYLKVRKRITSQQVQHLLKLESESESKFPLMH